MLKLVARNIVFPVAYQTGVDKLLRMGAKKHLNVTYHGVVNKTNFAFSPRHISRQQFEKHLIYFKKHFDIISVEEAFRRFRTGERSNRPTINISFDDGFENNLTVLLPLLEKHQVPTTVFVSGVCASGSKHVLWSEVAAALRFKFSVEKVQSADKLIELSRKGILVNDIKAMPVSERNPFINELVKTYNLQTVLNSVDTEQWRLLNPDQLKQLADSPLIEIGSHGMDHYNLDAIDEKSAQKELVQSKEILEEVLDITIQAFAYPDGAYNDKTLSLAQSAGYAYQMAVNYHDHDHVQDKRVLSRFSVPSTTTFESNMLQVNRAFHTHGF